MDGAITLTQVQLDDLAEAAAERGARKTLAGVGLHDDKAPIDVRPSRDLLGMYRVARDSALAALGNRPTPGPPLLANLKGNSCP